MNDLKSFELTWIKRTNIPKDLEKIDFLLNERFLWTNFSKNDGFLLNKRFHYTNDFTERSFREKANDYERYIFENEKNRLLKKKWTKWVVHERWTIEIKKNRTWPSLLRTSDATNLLLRSPEQMYLNAVKLSKHDHIWRIRLFKVDTTVYLIRQAYW